MRCPEIKQSIQNPEEISCHDYCVNVGGNKGAEAPVFEVWGTLKG